MTDNDVNTVDGRDEASLSSDEVGGSLNEMEKKNSFAKLEQSQKRRDDLVVKGVRAAVVVLVIAGVAVASQLFFTLNGKTVLEGARAEDAGIVSLQCDNMEEFSANPEHPCNLKIRFQDQYRELTTQLLPSIEASASEEFVQTSLAEIIKLEEKAIKAFDRSDFTVAVSVVDQALKSAENLTKLIAENFRRSFENAQAAFVANDAEAARSCIGQALRLKGQDAAAHDLFARISVLPEVVRLYQLAAEAEVQNQQLDLQKYLGRIVALDPKRQDASSRFSALTEQLKKSKYNEHLRQASQYIATENMRAARQEVNKANVLYPGQLANSALINQIDTIERTARIDTMLAEVLLLEIEDNWPKALILYGRILRDDNSNRAAINGREKANKIIAANERAIKALNSQNRFQDAKVQQWAIEFMELIKPLSAESKKLANTIVILQQRLDLWRQTIKVTVFSDGKSMVSVRRVGQVGIVTQKDIQLKPGKYDFECNRDGYKAKIVEHFVPPGQSGTSVTISCDVSI